MGGVDFDDSLDDGAYNGGGSPLHMASPEHVSAALAAGYAHLYSGIAFNLISESDCALTTWQSGDWDLMGPPCFNQTDTYSGTFMSCAVGRAPLAPAWGQRAYYEAMGYESPVSSSPYVPIDVVRFWWQTIQDHGLTFQDITDIYTAMNPSGWGSETDTSLETKLEVQLTLAPPYGLLLLSVDDYFDLRTRHLRP